MNRKIKLRTFSPKHFNLLLPIMKSGGDNFGSKKSNSLSLSCLFCHRNCVKKKKLEFIAVTALAKSPK